MSSQSICKLQTKKVLVDVLNSFVYLVESCPLTLSSTRYLFTLDLPEYWENKYADQTLEVLMSDLDPAIMDQFYTKDGVSASDVTRVSRSFKVTCGTSSKQTFIRGPSANAFRFVLNQFGQKLDVNSLVVERQTRLIDKRWLFTQQLRNF